MTLRSASSGRYFEAGSSRPILPCSTNCISATDVTGFVIEGIREIASCVGGAVGRNIGDAEAALIEHALAIGDQRHHAGHVLALDRAAQAGVDRSAPRCALR